MSHSLHRILVVDDEPENLRALERTLKSRFAVTTAIDPNDALKRLEGEEFAVVISDQRMPGMLGTEFLSLAAKLRPRMSRVILTAHTDTKEILDAINRAEIYRYVTKPWNNEELIGIVSHAAERYALMNYNEELTKKLAAKSERLEQKEKELIQVNKNLEKTIEQRTIELRTVNQRLSELAMTDPLTKILNRRAFSQKVVDEIERSTRYKHPILFAMIDVDHFKMFNDMEGHVYGDEALRKIAQIFSSNLRKSDVLARYGGEEFIVMMPETGLAGGKEICERLRKAVEQSAFQGSKEEAFLTISIGISAFPNDGETSEHLILAADASLYAAKEVGRNRVVYQPHAKQSEDDEESFFVT